MQLVKVVRPGLILSASFPTSQERYMNRRFEVLTAVLLESQVFWFVTPCQTVNNCGHFERGLFLHLQAEAVQDYLTLKMKARLCIEASVTLHQST